MKGWGMPVLAVWLVATGLVGLLSLSFAYSGTILALLAIAAGGLILMETRGAKLSRNLGTLLLSLWLIATGLLALFAVRFDGSGTLMAILAVAAGALLLMGR